MKKIFILITIFVYSSLSFSGFWKIYLNTSYQTFNLNDLEAQKDFWNIALINTAKHKNESGANIEVPERVEGIHNSPSIGISLEREIKSFFIKFSIDKFHKSYNPEFKLGDFQRNFYEIKNSIQETLDIFSPSLTLGYFILKRKNINISLNITGFLNFLTWKYSSELNWKVFTSNAEEIINILNKNYTQIKKLIPTIMPSLRTEIIINKIGLSFETGYNSGKSSNLTGNVDYYFSMNSAFHNSIQNQFKGETKIWIGESWIELMGYEYWIRTHLYGDEKPQESETLRNIKPAEIKFNNLSLKFSIFYRF